MQTLEYGATLLMERTGLEWKLGKSVARIRHRRQPRPEREPTRRHGVAGWDCLKATLSKWMVAHGPVCFYLHALTSRRCRCGTLHGRGWGGGATTAGGSRPLLRRSPLLYSRVPPLGRAAAVVVRRG